MYAEDIAVWSNKRGDTEIELYTYGVKFTIKQDGTLWLGNAAEYRVTRTGCHWTEHIDNTFLMERQGRYYLGVFENVMDKHRVRSFKHDIFSKKVNIRKADTRDDFYIIPVHKSGLTLQPSSYDAIWAYVNSCLMYAANTPAPKSCRSCMHLQM
jgi:hypothetical protein